MMTDIEVIDDGTLRTITTADTGRILGAGWLLYFFSLILNLVYYLMHPSSPEIWTWGAEEELEDWTPPDEKESIKQEQTQSQPEPSQIKLTESPRELEEWTPLVEMQTLEEEEEESG